MDGWECWPCIHHSHLIYSLMVAIICLSDPHIALTLGAKTLAPFVEQSPSLDMYNSAVVPN
jgi:hypothetical protein